MRVVEICRNGDDRFGDGFAEVVFGYFFHFLQHHGRYFLWGVQAAVDVDAAGVVVAPDYFIRYAAGFFAAFAEAHTHEPFDGRDRPGRVGDGLAFCRGADFALAVVQKAHDGRRRTGAFVIGDDNGFVADHHSHARVGCS